MRNLSFYDEDVLNEVSYLTIFNWEHINLEECRAWMIDNWTWSLYASTLYLTLIFYGQILMKKRPAFELRNVLLCWNIILAIFSIFGFLRTVPEIIHINSYYGFHISVCIKVHHNSATAFWGWLMAWSKLVELGDTAFIVLRKQPLIFLHWYHHISVFVFTWVNYGPYDLPMRYFMSMNLFVHGLMYTYYALKCLRYRVPRYFAMTLTLLQLSQMIVGVWINIYSLWIKVFKQERCDRHYDGIYTALGMYASYMVLFTQFFYNAYFTRPQLKRA